MKAINKIFLRIATEESRTITLDTGEKIFFDDSYNENWYKKQIGQIVYIPEKYSTEDNDVPLFKGDVVYFHHLASDDVNKIMIEGEALYMQPIEEIYAVKREGRIICLRDIVFVEQLTESEDKVKTKSGIWLKEKAEEIKQEGIVIALSPASKEWEFLGEDIKFGQKIEVGSHIKFKKRSEFEVNADFGKRKVYRMPIENVLMVMKPLEKTTV